LTRASRLFTKAWGVPWATSLGAYANRQQKGVNARRTIRDIVFVPGADKDKPWSRTSTVDKVITNGAEPIVAPV
jgi:hypothetical protein